jgi:Aerotolerance regulator N-terminal
MPFSFLNPWFWLGAVALGAPLWLHLRRKRQTHLLRFSTIRFLEDEPQPRRSPMRLRDVLLFVLRVLALLLVIAAFAWPYLPGVNTAPITESRVYILDNTLSHQASNGFARDRAQVLSEISDAGTDVQVAVVELTALPRVVVAFGDSRQQALENVQVLQPSHQRGSYLAAFRQANALLENSLGERKHIVFLGDNQENQWADNANTPAFLRRVQVDIPKPPAAALPNLALSDPRVQRIFLGDRSLANFTVRLTHLGPAKTANVILSANGQSVFNRAVNLENQPETILLQAQWETDPGTWLRGEATVEGTPDALAADNRVFFALAPVVEGKVALLTQSPYLRLALSPEIMRGQWSTRFLDPTRLSQESSATEQADVFCLDSSYLQSAEVRKLLFQFLSNGRGALLLVNRTTPAIDGCLRELGLEPQGVVRTENTTPEKFQFVLSNHPIFHPFLSPDYGNLMEIQVHQYVRLHPGQAQPLIFGERGGGLFFQGLKLKGKLYVCAFGLDREQTSWPIHQSFIPFLDLALQAARAEDPMPTRFEPGQFASVLLPAAGGPTEVVLRDEGREVARAAVQQGKARLRMPDQPGLYALSFDASDRVEKMLSVNASPRESDLTYSESPETLKLWHVDEPFQPATASVTPARAHVRLAGVLQQRWWWWMVLGSLAALFLETMWAGTRRDQA